MKLAQAKKKRFKRNGVTVVLVCITLLESGALTYLKRILHISKKAGMGGAREVKGKQMSEK